MANSRDDHSSCGCKGIFCCIFRSSRDSNEERVHLPITEDKKTKNGPISEPHYSGYENYLPKQSHRSDSDANKAFSEYINQAKVKIRATSNVGRDDIEIVDDPRDHGVSEKRVDANDMFTDYIARAKLKIRKSSSIGSKRVISFRQ